MKWTVTLLVDPIPEAFSIDGNIFVSTGLLQFSSQDDELAITLSHEMAHSLLGHGVSKCYSIIPCYIIQIT